jgi:hypothetical protein
MDVNGSLEFALTWKQHDMPAGVPICQLQALGRRTVGSASSGWPTPRAEDAESSGTRHSRGVADTLTAVTRLAGWPTPMAGTPAQESYNEAGNTDSSRQTVALVQAWSTPTAETQRKSARAMKRSENNGRRSGGGQSSPPGLEQEAELAAGIIPKELQGDHMAPTREALGIVSPWPTPDTPSGGANSKRKERGAGGANLMEVANWADLAHWPTPNTMTGGQTSRGGDRKGEKLVSGLPLTSSLAPTEKRGALSPEHSRWLMGFPAGWSNFAGTATRSSRKSRPNSSALSKKPTA